jgi:hypothetical protein
MLTGTEPSNLVDVARRKRLACRFLVTGSLLIGMQPVFVAGPIAVSLFEKGDGSPVLGRSRYEVQD